MHKIDLADGTLAYRDIGSGYPLVFLHGFPLNHNMWSGQIAEFSTTHRVIAPDLRGHGESTVTTGTVSMEDLAHDAARLLEAAQITSPVVLCGLSMGGYVAWEFWRHYRDQLAGLVLCDTRAVADTEEVARARQMMAAQVVDVGPQLAVDSMLSKLLAEENYERQPEVVAYVEQTILATDPEGIAATQRGMAQRGDMSELLSQVETPTLVLCGSEDRISPPAEMARIAEAMPHAHFVEIAGAGHLAPLEQPTATNSALSQFLANIGEA